MSILFYRRPDYVHPISGPMDYIECQKYVERTQNYKAAVPSELSFENIIQDKAMPPCSLEDFMGFLVHVSHNAENLQFFLWFKDYTQKFSATPESEQKLSPPWDHTKAPCSSGNDSKLLKPAVSARKKQGVIGYTLKFEDHESPQSPPWLPIDTQSLHSGTSASTKRSFAESAEEAYVQAGLIWKPYTSQPFRAEIDLVVSHYLARNSPRELNLSHRDREGVLHALQHTTHPSALALINATVEATLRGQSHPNFVRWSICNGNKPRQVFVRNISIGHVMAGLFMAVLLILSHASRWWRLFVFPLIFVGFDVGVAAYKGLCVILHTNNNRALRPWEDLDDTYSLSNLDRNAAAATEANASTDDVFSTHSRSTTISLDPFGSSNNLSHELLIERYKKIPLMKKIFAKRVLVQNEAIRLMQDKIVLQSHGWALIITLILTAALVALPKGNVI